MTAAQPTTNGPKLVHRPQQPYGSALLHTGMKLFPVTPERQGRAFNQQHEFPASTLTDLNRSEEPQDPKRTLFALHPLGGCRKLAFNTTSFWRRMVLELIQVSNDTAAVLNYSRIEPV